MGRPSPHDHARGEVRPRHFSLIYRFAYNVAKIPVSLVTKRHWQGQQYLPKDTGFIAASNHLSEFDSMTYMHFLLFHGVPVRILVKDSLFKVPFLKFLLKKTGQIPVHRASSAAKDALADAVTALQQGECIGIFPEGTLTRDPDYWPMRAKTGVARMALRAQVPVIPIAQWGPQDVLDRYRGRFRLFPPKDVYVHALEPVDLTDLYDRADDPDAWREATDRIMAAIRAEVGRLRGEDVPEKIWNTKVDPDLGKKGLKRLAQQWERRRPDLLPSERPTVHRKQQ